MMRVFSEVKKKLILGVSFRGGPNFHFILFLFLFYLVLAYVWFALKNNNNNKFSNFVLLRLQ